MTILYKPKIRLDLESRDNKRRLCAIRFPVRGSAVRWPHAVEREEFLVFLPCTMAMPGSPSPSSPKSDSGGVGLALSSVREIQLLNRDLEMKLQSPSVPTSIPAAHVPSYAARFKSSLRNLRKISDPSFLEDGTPVMQAPESVLLKTLELWKDHVVCHFHGRRPHANKIIADLNPVWGKFGNITVRTVPSVQTREWVLQVGYWQADRCAFSVYPWSADGNLAAQELLFALTWVVLKDVPPQLYSLDGISVVASGVGEPLHTEKSRLDQYHFGDTKVKVEIDLSTTPPEVVEVRDTQGNSVRINIEYPSLPPKCINSGKFGHLLNRCHKPLMKITQTQKKIEQVVSVVKSGKDVSLAESGQVLSKDTQEDEVPKKKKSRSRSRRRSRFRAKERALSSPPEMVVPVVSSSQIEEGVVISELEVSSLQKHEKSELVQKVEGCGPRAEVTSHVPSGVADLVEQEGVSKGLGEGLVDQKSVEEDESL